MNKNAVRFQMSLMVIVTALAGLIASFLMLAAGIKQMWLRYPVAVLVAYGVFLFLIWLWIRFQHNRIDDGFDLPDVISSYDGSPIDASSFGGFGGGESGGGGASGSFSTTPSIEAPDSSEGGILDALDLPFDLDELILVFALLCLVLFALTAAVIVVVSAPALLGEVLVDSLVAAGLYRRLKKLEQRNWLESAVRRTWWLALGILIVFTIAGFIFQSHAPGADSIGDVWSVLLMSLRYIITASVPPRSELFLS